jgi:copper homeostasis protein
MTLLEVCCYSMACALEAQRCGADRIELCAAPQEGADAFAGGAEIGA